eukprot:gene23577-9104_t
MARGLRSQVTYGSLALGLRAISAACLGPEGHRQRGLGLRAYGKLWLGSKFDMHGGLVLSCNMVVAWSKVSMAAWLMRSKMLFMDWRDDHTKGDEKMRAENKALPTFLYAMPFSKTKVFLEETSLVARPAISFSDLKERLDARLKWLGIKVTKIEEEEYCLIPMGGVLPKHPQRVLALGGTAGMPLAPKRPPQKLTVEMSKRRYGRQMAHSGEFAKRAFSLRNDILLSLNLAQTRQFFSAFFSLSDFHWHGFLSARLTFLELIGFGLVLFVQSSNDVRLYLLKLGLPGLIQMLIYLAPTLGNYYGEKTDKTKAAVAVGEQALLQEKEAAAAAAQLYKIMTSVGKAAAQV